jgi:uncharacterized membrane protein YidH (DUF202 family)
MDNKPVGTSTIKDELRGIRILAAALIIGVIIFAIITVVINQINGAFLDSEIISIRAYLLPFMSGLALLALLIARNQYQKQIRAIREGNDELRDKIVKYRAAIILYMAICEGMAMFSIVLFLLSGEYLLLLVTGAMLFLMAARLYAINGISAELDLSWEEQEALN